MSNHTNHFRNITSAHRALAHVLPTPRSSLAWVLLLLFLWTGAAQAAPLGPGGKTATVAVTITILPYANVQLDVDHVDITLPPGPGSAGPVYVGGTIRTNVPATIYVRITAPQNAPGTWTAQPEVRELPSAGVYRLDTLLQIMVWDLPSGSLGHTYTVLTQGQFAPTVGGVQTPGAGVVIVTVVPQ